MLMLRQLFMLCACLLLASPANATVDWTEGFEDANQTALEAVWGSSCIGNSSIISPSATRAD